MARTKENKIVSKKKINHYTINDCEKALAKLASEGNTSSKHHNLIASRLQSLQG